MPDNEQQKWDKLDDSLETKITRLHNNREVVSRADLEKLWTVSPKTLQRYAKDGMPTCVDLWKRNFQVFYLDECLEWKAQNIDRKQSQRASKSKSGAENKVDLDRSSDDEETKKERTPLETIQKAKELLDIENTDSIEAERIKDIVVALEKSLLLEIKIGELIPAKDTRNALIEMASTMSRGLKQLSKSIPRECVGLREEEIEKKVVRLFRNKLSDMKKFLKGQLTEEQIEMATDEKLIDIIEVAYKAIEDGVPLVKIIKAIGGVK